MQSCVLQLLFSVLKFVTVQQIRCSRQTSPVCTSLHKYQGKKAFLTWSVSLDLDPFSSCAALKTLALRHKTNQFIQSVDHLWRQNCFYLFQMATLKALKLERRLLGILSHLLIPGQLLCEMLIRLPVSESYRNCQMLFNNPSTTHLSSFSARQKPWDLWKNKADHPLVRP